MNNKPVLVVMAAGLASRYGSLKQIDPVGPNKEILMEYSIYNAILAGFKDILFLVSPKMEIEMRKTLCSRLPSYLNLNFAVQTFEDIPMVCTPIHRLRRKPLGTAHAIHCCRDYINSSFAVINADDYYGRECFEFLYNHLSNVDIRNADYSMIGYRLKNTLSKYGSVTRGICQVEDNNLVQISDLPHIEVSGNNITYERDGYIGNLDPNAMTSMGVWGFTPTIFKTINDELIYFLDHTDRRDLDCELRLPDVIDKAIARKECSIKVFETSDTWFGMTYEADKAITMEMIDLRIKREEFPVKLWE